MIELDMTGHVSFFNSSALDSNPPAAPVTPDTSIPAIASLVTVPSPAVGGVAFAMTLSGSRFAARRVPTLVSLLRSGVEFSVVPASYTDLAIVANFGTSVTAGSYTVRVSFSDLTFATAPSLLAVT